MNKVVYFNEEKAFNDELSIQATVSDLLSEKADMFYERLRDNVRLWSSAIVFIGLALCWRGLAESAYLQDLAEAPSYITVLVSLLNVLGVSIGVFVAYLIVYNVIKTVAGMVLFSKGIFFQRKVKGYARLFHKVSKGAFTELYFKKDGVVSRVTVTNFYANLYNIGEKVPVVIEYVMLNTPKRVAIVKACVGSRDDSLSEMKTSMEMHFVDGGDDDYMHHTEYRNRLGYQETSSSSLKRIGG